MENAYSLPPTFAGWFDFSKVLIEKYFVNFHLCIKKEQVFNKLVQKTGKPVFKQGDLNWHGLVSKRKIFSYTEKYKTCQNCSCVACLIRIFQEGLFILVKMLF